MASLTKLLIIKNIAVLQFVFLSICFSGCAKYGSVFLQSERSLYNQAIQKTNDEQLLLNLVRLKYHDTPLFLGVNNIASQFTLQKNIGLSAQLQSGAKGIFTPDASAFVEEKPTISYSPLQGEKFVKGVLTAVSLKTVVLLFNSGWSIERIFKVCLQRVDTLKNAPSASGPTPKTAPKTEKFFFMAKVLRELQTRGALELKYQEHDEIPQLVIRISDSFKNSKLANEFTRLINGSIGKTTYIFEAPSVKDKTPIDIVSRSLLGIIFYLSHGVEVPELDLKEGRVVITKKENGDVFDWKNVTGELIVIHSSATQPEDAMLKVFYRDHWFYINDSDLISKSTFSLLAQIYALQSDTDNNA
jgi:hypothetical protein